MLTYRGDKFIKGKKFTINESVYRFQKRDNKDNLIFEGTDGEKLKLSEEEFNKKSIAKIGKETFRSVGDLDSHIDSVAKEFGVSFNNKTPFEYFYAPTIYDDNEEEIDNAPYSSDYDWATFYDRILHDLGYGDNPVLNDLRATVEEVSDGKCVMYLVKDGIEYEVDLSSWDKKDDVKENVEYILGVLNGKVNEYGELK